MLAIIAIGTATVAAFGKLNPALLPVTTYTMTTAGPAMDHSGYDRLLKKYVTDKSLVNYKGLKADEKESDRYLALLSKKPPAASKRKNEQIAYWIYACNVYTIRLIFNYYSVKSIKEIGSSIQIPRLEQQRLVGSKVGTPVLENQNRRTDSGFLSGAALRKWTK